MTRTLRSWQAPCKCNRRVVFSVAEDPSIVPQATSAAATFVPEEDVQATLVCSFRTLLEHRLLNLDLSMQVLQSRPRSISLRNYRHLLPSVPAGSSWTTYQAVPAWTNLRGNRHDMATFPVLDRSQYPCRCNNHVYILPVYHFDSGDSSIRCDIPKSTISTSMDPSQCSLASKFQVSSPYAPTPGNASMPYPMQFWR